MQLKILVSPSISPVYYNNPGFSLFEVNWDGTLQTFKIADMKYHFFDLLNYLLFRTKQYREINVQSSLGVDVNSADSIRDMTQKMMNNMQMFTKYESVCYGLDSWAQTIFYSLAIFYIVMPDSKYQQWSLCLDSYFERNPNSQGLISCLENLSGAREEWLV